MRYLMFIAILMTTVSLSSAQDAASGAVPPLPSEMKVFYLQTADVSEAVKLIEDLLPDEIRKSGVRLLPEPRTNALYMQGNTSSQEWVEAFLQRYDKDAESRTLPPVGESVTESIAVVHVDSREAMNVIESLGFVGDTLSVAIAPRGQRLIVRGRKEAVAEVMALLKEIDEPGPGIRGESGRDDSSENRMMVSLQANGQVLVEGVRLQPGGFADSFNADSVVVIEVERDVHHAEVVSLIEILRKAGVSRLSIGARAVPQQAMQTPANAANAAPSSRGPISTDPIQQAYVSAEQAAAQTAAKWRGEQKRSPLDSDAISALASALEQEVRAAFRLRQQWQQLQLDRHLAELDRLAARVARREQIADQIVSHRVRELQSGKDLSWLPSPHVSGGSPIESGEPSAAANSAAAAVPSKATQSGFSLPSDLRPAAPMTPAGIATSPAKYANIGEVPSRIATIASATNDQVSSKTTIEAQPTKAAELLQLANGGRLLTVTARSKQHAEQIRTLLREYFPNQHLGAKSETRLVINGSEKMLEQVASLVKDLDVRQELRSKIEAASEVSVKLHVASAKGVSWALDDVQYDLPAEFKMDSGQQLLLELQEINAIHNRSMYASIEILPLSQDALAYFQSHKLPLAVSIPDMIRCREGVEIRKSCYLVRRNGTWQLDTSSTVDASSAGSKPRGERVAELTVGNSEPHLTGDRIYSRSITRGSRTVYMPGDSVLFVEMIVSPLHANEGPGSQRRAIYMDGIVVDDEGLIAVVTDELSDESGKLNVDVESITLKTHKGKAIYDATIVAQDPKSGLALLRSNQLPVPSLRLDGPEVVDAQGLRQLGRTTLDLSGVRVFQEEGWANDAKVLATNGFDTERPGRFLATEGGYGIPGPAVTLSTTGQLVGIYTGVQSPFENLAGNQEAQEVIAVSVIDELIRRYRNP